MLFARRFAWLFSVAWVFAAPALADEAIRVLRVGSKPFTESVVLAEIARFMAIQSGEKAVRHEAELGGSQIVWKALQAGQIDIYPEYTGTLLSELVADRKIDDFKTLQSELRAMGVGMTGRLGFNNSYALGLRPERADELKIQTIEDLKKHPTLRLGLSDEFLERKDGWPNVVRTYGLPQGDTRGMHHSLALRGLLGGKIDVTDVYTTDAEIREFNLRVLKDNLRAFPVYSAVILYRLELERTHPHVVQALRKLENQIDEVEMVSLNCRVQVDEISERRAAAEFVNRRFSETIHLETIEETTWWKRRLARFWRNTFEHLFLVAFSLTMAVLISVPMGIWCYRSPAAAHLLLNTVGVIQTLPSMALLVFMIPFLGLGFWPAIVALFLYSLLPIVRNTYQGLKEIPESLRESAAVLGLPPWPTLFRVELPMASRSIVAGIKIAAVINIGTATIGALIGAGGYGEPILTGIRLNDVGLILQGAVPAAVLALLAQAGFTFLERWVVPKGLLLQSG